MYLTSRPLASRVIGRSHLEGLRQKEMAGYLKHHLEIAGIKEQLFSMKQPSQSIRVREGFYEEPTFLQRFTHLRRTEKCLVVSAEHVRMASTEIF